MICVAVPPTPCASCALRFFYGVTLGRSEVLAGIVSAREPQKLPVVLSADEIDRRGANRAAHQPDAAHGQHQLLDALPQRLSEPRLRRHASASCSRPRLLLALGHPP